MPFTPAWCWISLCILLVHFFAGDLPARQSVRHRCTDAVRLTCQDLQDLHVRLVKHMTWWGWSACSFSWFVNVTCYSVDLRLKQQEQSSSIWIRPCQHTKALSGTLSRSWCLAGCPSCTSYWFSFNHPCCCNYRPTSSSLSSVSCCCINCWIIFTLFVISISTWILKDEWWNR